MELKVQHLGGVRFEARTRGHRVVCDQPLENQGGDAGMTPPEYLLAALGTCAGFYAAQYLTTRSFQPDGLEVCVTADKLAHPARLGQFRIDVTLPIPLDPQHQAGLLRAVKACLIHNTLLQASAIETLVHAAVPLHT